MGRRKIIIKQIPDVKLRHITFNKRKNGLFKKAAELSMLCNLNLLLVCEDGLGNLIQFSKNKVNDLNHFLSQCNYQNIIDLTSDDYPDFSRINKKKDKDGADSDSDGNDDYLPSDKETYAPPPVTQSGRATRKLPIDQLNNFGEPPEKSLKNKKLQKEPQPEELPSSANDLDALHKKNKNKLGLRLKIPKGAEPQESQSQAINDPQQKLPIANPEQNNLGYDRLRPKNEFIQQQPPRSVDKPMEFTPGSFMPFMDPLKRLNNIYDQSMASPFKFYAQQQARMDSLNSVLKGLSPFTFPLTSSSLVNKAPLTEEENKLLESTNAQLRYMNSRAQLNAAEAGSAHSHKVFTFQPEEGMPNANQLTQLNNLNNRNNELALMNQRGLPSAGMPDYVNLPSIMKSEGDFDINLPPDTLSARRFNFEGYFRDFDENASNAIGKRYKMT